MEEEELGGGVPGGGGVEEEEERRVSESIKQLVRNYTKIWVLM